MPLREHDLHRRLRDALVGEEIQLEALPQHRFVDLADASLPGGAGVGDEDVDAAEGLDHLHRSGIDRGCVGDVAGDRAAAARTDCRGRAFAAATVEDRAAPPRRRPPRTLWRWRAPMAPPAPVMTAICPANGRSFSLPSLACSIGQYSQSNMSASVIGSKRPIASASVMPRPRLRRDRRRCARPSRSGRARTGQAPAPARRAAADRACACRRRRAHCGGRSSRL